MFTVEFEPDAAVITTLDQKDMFEDVELVIGDGIVTIRQVDEWDDVYQLIMMSEQQLQDILAAYNSPEGAYRQVARREK